MRTDAFGHSRPVRMIMRTSVLHWQGALFLRCGVGTLSLDAVIYKVVRARALHWHAPARARVHGYWGVSLRTRAYLLISRGVHQSARVRA